jgi:hypothetical protein
MSVERTKICIPSLHGYDIPCLDGTIPEQKAVIICMHGFGGSKSSSRIESLHKEMIPCQVGTFAFDWPGHGESKSGFENLTVKNCLEDLKQVYDYVTRLHHVPVWCFATSFGGYMAVLYHDRYPEAFEKIMLRSPALKMGQILLNDLDEKERKEFLAGAPRDFGFDQPLILTRDSYYDFCAHDAFAVVPEHPERMFIIHGDQDDLVPPEDSVEFARKHNIKIQLLKGADHMYDNPGDIEWVMDRAKEFYV